MASNECAAVRAQLSAYLDGELDESTAQELLAHVRVCADCATLLNTFAKTLELYDGLPRPALSDATLARLKRAVQIE